MKILLVNFEYTLTGASLVLLRLAEHLRSAGHEVAVFGVMPNPGPIKAQLLRRRFPLVEDPLAGAYDVAICNTLMTAPMVSRLAGAVKTVWWIHEGAIGVDILLSNPSYVSAFAQATVVAFTLPFCRDAIYRSFVYHLDPARIAVIPCGVPEIAAAPPRPADPRPIRVISVGSIYPRKRHADLIHAVSRLPHLPIECTILGRFYALPDGCRRIVAANPDRFRLVCDVELDDSLDNSGVIAAVAESDIFCLPSGSEVQGLATLEAALLEKPVVLPDLAVYQGIWRHGRNCLIYPLASVPLLADAIALLAANPPLRQELGAAARRAARPFTNRASFAAFDALLDSL